MPRHSGSTLGETAFRKGHHRVEPNASQPIFAEIHVPSVVMKPRSYGGKEREAGFYGEKGERSFDGAD